MLWNSRVKSWWFFTKKKINRRLSLTLDTCYAALSFFLELAWDASQIKTIFWSEREKKPEKPPNNCKSKWQKPQSKSPKNSAISFFCCHGWFCLQLVNSPENSEKCFWNSKTIQKRQNWLQTKSCFLGLFLVVFGFRIVSLTQQRTKKRLQTIFGTQPPWVWLWFFSERGPETSSKKKRISSFFPCGLVAWCGPHEIVKSSQMTPKIHPTQKTQLWSFVTETLWIFLPSKTIAEKQSCTP